MIQAADSNDWALYMVIMGGPNAKKQQQPIWLRSYSPTDKFNEYEEPVLAVVIGVESAGDYEQSREHVWEKKLKAADSEILESGSDCGHLEFCQ